ncbi:MAG: trypsin-like peptidase domain-containing protein [Candidatus Cloacimonadales bacterium]
MKRNDVLIILVILVISWLLYTHLFEDETQANAIDLPQVAEPQQHDRTEAVEELNIQRQNSITNAVNLVEDAVVSVNVTKTEIVQRQINPFHSNFFGFFDNNAYRREVKSIGSGVIISQDGYIISNSHVVEGATQIMIILPDNRQFEAELIGVASRQDIAVLKIAGDDLPVAELGTSADLIIGEWAIALGNPYGFMIKDSKPSVSVGVISAVERDFSQNRDGKIYREMIQTDAAINPGNSGGPLVNIYGKIIGINTFIFSETGGNIGMGFAIPIDRVMSTVEELIQFGKVRNIWLDFGVQEITPMSAQYLGLESQDGIIVTSIDRNSPAAVAGLQAGDVIVGINDNLVTSVEDAQLAVTDIRVGDMINFTVLRDGKDLSIAFEAIEQ